MQNYDLKIEKAYANVTTKMLTHTEHLVYLYMMTCKANNILGAFKLPIDDMCRNIGLSKCVANNVLDCLCNKHKLIWFDEVTMDTIIFDWSEIAWTKVNGKPIKECYANIVNELDKLGDENFDKVVLLYTKHLLRITDGTLSAILSSVRNEELGENTSIFYLLKDTIYNKRIPINELQCDREEKVRKDIIEKKEKEENNENTIEVSIERVLDGIMTVYKSAGYIERFNRTESRKILTRILTTNDKNIHLSHYSVFCAVKFSLGTAVSKEKPPEYVKMFSTFLANDVYDIAGTNACRYAVKKLIEKKYGDTINGKRFVYTK